MRDMVVVKRYRAALADILTAVCQTPAAGIGNLESGGGAFIAGNVDNLNNIAACSFAADRNMDPFAQYCALLINTAAHCRRFSGNDLFGYFRDIFGQSAVPCASGNFTQDLVFKVLYLGIEFSD